MIDSFTQYPDNLIHYHSALLSDETISVMPRFASF